jgi:hypothetical protein
MLFSVLTLALIIPGKLLAFAIVYMAVGVAVIWWSRWLRDRRR